MEGSSIERRHQKSRYTLREYLNFIFKITTFQDLMHHLIRRQIRQYLQAPNFSGAFGLSLSWTCSFVYNRIKKIEKANIEPHNSTSHTLAY